MVLMFGLKDECPNYVKDTISGHSPLKAHWLRDAHASHAIDSVRRCPKFNRHSRAGPTSIQGILLTGEDAFCSSAIDALCE